MDRTQQALRAMAREDPELAARIVLMTLPAAAARIHGKLDYELAITGVGSWRVSVEDGDARVVEAGADGVANGEPLDFRLSTDPQALAALVTGEGLRAILDGRVRIRGKRRRALRLRAMGSPPAPTIADAARRGARIDPDPLLRALPYLIDSEWTRGHRFTVAYEIDGATGGPWYVQVRDGEPLLVTAGRAPGRVDATAKLGQDAYQRLVAGEITPTQAMQRRLTTIDGDVPSVTLLGRWIDRAQGRDDAELVREREQRAVQERRRGTWGSEADGHTRGQGELMSYGELYALWERQNWRAHEIDFAVDREQWLVTPREAQENTIWSLGSFYLGEERVTADLAPFLLAAPSGEVEVFLATQLVDEARHAAFFDRFGAEVMALDAEDLRGRLRELERAMLHPWHDVFDDGLRDVADRIKERPGDLDLFVEGITTYHMIVEGVLAMTGQRFILKYMEDHGLYPGFQRGFSLVEQDEHRHIAFGVRYLKDAVERDPRHAETIMRRIRELVPRAALVFVPPYAESPERFVSYGYDSAQIYGYAYRALKRRLAVIGLEAPPPEELMPGPIATPEEARAAGAPV